MDSESSFENSSEDEKEAVEEPASAALPKQEKLEQAPPQPKKPSLKDYEMLGVLGEGAFGKVHHVVSKSDGQQFALKVLAKKNMTKKVQNEVQRERSILMKADHSNIIKLHQCFHDPRNLYFVMECAQNGELFRFMQNEGKLSLKVGQFLAAEIVSMIAYLQTLKICHRDMKPSNLIFDSEMHLKLIDFGAGKVYNENELSNKSIPSPEDSQSGSNGTEVKKSVVRSSTLIGTCEYMAPEVIQGAYVTNACDLWALGIMIYMFFAEMNPFAGGMVHEMQDRILEEDVSFPEDFPEEAKDLVSQLLEKDPVKRLGAGLKGSENDIFALQSHPFFKGIDFETLHEQKSPIPKPVKRMNSAKRDIIAKYLKSSPKKSAFAQNEEKPDRKMTEPGTKSGPFSDMEESEIHQAADKSTIEGWKHERHIKIVHKELIKMKKALIFYNATISITTDEPALYLYNLKTGILKARYDLKFTKLQMKNKKKFVLKMNGPKGTKKLSDKFKLISHKKSYRDSQNLQSIINVLQNLAK